MNYLAIKYNAVYGYLQKNERKTILKQYRDCESRVFCGEDAKNQALWYASVDKVSSTKDFKKFVKLKKRLRKKEAKEIKKKQSIIDEYKQLDNLSHENKDVNIYCDGAIINNNCYIAVLIKNENIEDKYVYSTPLFKRSSDAEWLGLYFSLMHGILFSSMGYKPIINMDFQYAVECINDKYKSEILLKHITASGKKANKKLKPFIEKILNSKDIEVKKIPRNNNLAHKLFKTEEAIIFSDLQKEKLYA